jgi:hypothetical protein
VARRDPALGAQRLERLDDCGSGDAEDHGQGSLTGESGIQREPTVSERVPQRIGELARLSEWLCLPIAERIPDLRAAHPHVLQSS